MGRSLMGNYTYKDFAQYIVYMTIVIGMLLESLGRLNLAPSFISNISELWSLSLYILIVFIFFKTGRLQIKTKYVIVFFLLVIDVLAGAVASSIDPGAFIVGMRWYIRFLPLFLLPAIINFSEEDLSKQLKLCLLMVFLQIPISFYQRFVLGANLLTGDVVKGTFSTGGHQAIFLFAVVTFLVTLFLRNKLSGLKLGILITLCLSPNTINETKSSLIFLPIALLVPIFFMRDKKRLRKSLLILLVPGFIFVSIFLLSYQKLYVDTNERFESNSEALSADYLEKYLTRADAEKGKYGRIGKLVETWRVLSEDPITLMFGMGLGNTTSSNFGRYFQGEFYNDYSMIKGATLSYLMFDIGLIGLLLCVVMFIYIFKDAKNLSARDDAYGYLAQAWLGVLVILIFASTYRNIMIDSAIGYLLTYYSGVIASHAAMRKSMP